MTDENTPARHPFEPRPADLAAAQRSPSSDLERFLGGSPLSVAVRLLFLSLIVGFFLGMFSIRPIDLLIGLRDMVLHLWEAGFDALRDIGVDVAAGAAIVVPLWLVLRLLNMKPKT
jgi:hypothetical protein